MKVRAWQISVTIVCVVLGFLLAVQLRTQSAKSLLPPAGSEQLVRAYREVQSQVSALETEAAALKGELRKAAEGKSVLVAMNAELEKARLLAGTGEVQGPGLQVVLKTKEVKPPSGSNEELFLIHDEDILNVVNELVAAGAEAVSINGERRTARTEVRRAGATLSVNNHPVGEPFVISAVGNPEAMERALEIKGGVIDALRAWGIDITITQAEKLIIPAYKGGIDFFKGRVPGSGAEEAGQ